MAPHAALTVLLAGVALFALAALSARGKSPHHGSVVVFGLALEVARLLHHGNVDGD
jgi:hypothetical protein